MQCHKVQRSLIRIETMLILEALLIQDFVSLIYFNCCWFLELNELLVCRIFAQFRQVFGFIFYFFLVLLQNWFQCRHVPCHQLFYLSLDLGIEGVIKLIHFDEEHLQYICFQHFIQFSIFGALEAMILHYQILHLMKL